MQVQILRKFSGSPPVGAIVDTDDWAVNRVHQLTKRRFVQPVLGPPVEMRRGPGRPRKDEATP